MEAKHPKTELCLQIIARYNISEDLLIRAKKDIINIKSISNFSKVMNFRQNFTDNNEIDLKMDDTQKLGLVHLKLIIDSHSLEDAKEIALLNLKRLSVQKEEENISRLAKKYINQ